MMQFMFDKMEQHGAARRDVANTFYKRIRTKQGCAHVATLWQAVLEKLEESGLPLSESAEYNIRQELGGDSGYFRVEAFCVVNRAVREKDIHPLKEGEEKGMNEWAMGTAKDLQKFFASIADILEEDEEEKVYCPHALPPPSIPRRSTHHWVHCYCSYNRGGKCPRSFHINQH